MRKVFILTLLAGVSFAGAAHADQAGWCAAYARDFADSRATDKILWQHKYDIAQKSCLDNESSAPAPVADAGKRTEVPVAVAQKKPEAAPLKAELAPMKVASIPAPKTAVSTTPPAPEKVKTASGAPEVGTAEWNAYCAKKYSSFDAKTGTYQSLTGVQRKCLYTG